MTEFDLPRDLSTKFVIIGLDPIIFLRKFDKDCRVEHGNDMKTDFRKC